MKKHTAVLKNISHVEDLGVVFSDRNINYKLHMNPRQLIAHLKCSKDGWTYETMSISIEHKWNGQSKLLFRIKFRNEAKGLVNHLEAHLCKEHEEEC